MGEKKARMTLGEVIEVLSDHREMFIVESKSLDWGSPARLYAEGHAEAYTLALAYLTRVEMPPPPPSNQNWDLP